jgi:pyruvate kinase
MSTVRQLSLSYGVYSSKIDMPQTTDELVKVCLLKMIEEKQITQDDLIVFVGGGHQNEAQHTNMIQIETPAILLKQ